MNLLASFGDIFGVDTLMIFFLVLLLYGVRRLPKLGEGIGRESSESKDEERESRKPLPAGAWMLLPLGIITVLSCLGVLTREQVLGLLLALLLIWVVGKMGGPP
jgi:hypothetical protein